VYIFSYFFTNIFTLKHTTQYHTTPKQFITDWKQTKQC